MCTNVASNPFLIAPAAISMIAPPQPSLSKPKLASLEERPVPLLPMTPAAPAPPVVGISEVNPVVQLFTGSWTGECGIPAAAVMANASPTPTRRSSGLAADGTVRSRGCCGCGGFSSLLSRLRRCCCVGTRPDKVCVLDCLADVCYGMLGVMENDEEKREEARVSDQA